MAIFDDLIKLSAQFVETKKGVWDHKDWIDFLSNVQKIDISMTEDMQNYLGLILESMGKFYENSADIGKIVMENVSEQTAKFIEETKGQWEHLEWMKFVKDIQQRGISLTEDTQSFLGEILETSKKFYFSLPLVTKEAKEEKEVKVKKEKKIEKKKEPEVTKAKAPEKVEEPKKEEKPTVKKESKVKVEEKPSKKEEIKAEKKEEAKEAKEAKRAEETKVVKTEKKAKVSAPPKKEPAKKPAVKKQAKPAAKETAKVKATSTSKKE